MFLVGFFFLLFFMTLDISVAAETKNISNSSARFTDAQNAGTTRLDKNIILSEGTAIDKAYVCLDRQISNKSSLSFQEAVFGMLALGAKKQLVDSMQSAKDSKESCWPKGACKIKETAQATLAHRRAGIGTGDSASWLKSKKGFPSELSWFLEIDITQHVPASCTISYDGREYKTSIKEDMTLAGGAGSCLTPSSNQFWLRINSNCLDKSFQISCDQDFVTTILYQKTNGETVFVSSATESASSLGTTTESIKASCFKSGASCDYEGSLWAALALQQLNEDISEYIPYLIALADDNLRFFPSAFLYYLSSDDEYFSQITQLKKQNQFWEVSGNLYNRFYDTALGMLALGSSSSGEIELASTKKYVLDIQTKDGCWNNNNIRDTSFLLYAGWQRAALGSKSAGLPACSEAGFSCERLSECTAAGGTKKEGYECPSGLSICCSVKIERKTCENENGKLCKASEKCDGATFEANNGACCLGSCLPFEQPEINECEQSNGVCKASCDSDEEESSESCTTGTDICCAKKLKKSIGYGWIIALLILIAVVGIAILYRDSLRLWWFKYRGRARVKPMGGRPGGTTDSAQSSGYYRPPRPPPSFGAPMQRSQVPPRPALRPASSRAISPHDKEMEETLKKLKEMTK